MYIHFKRFILFALVVLLAGCEVRRTQENPVSDEISISQVDAVPSTSPPSFWDRIAMFFGFRTPSTPWDEIPSSERPGLNDFDVRVYALKKQIAADLARPENANGAECQTDFDGFFSMRNNLQTASEVTEKSRGEQAAEWQAAQEEAARQLSGEAAPAAASPPFPTADSIQAIRDPRRLSVSENYAFFNILIDSAPHFSQIQVRSLNDRFATLLVEAQGNVHADENRPREFTSQPLLLEYSFTKQPTGWSCTHLHVSFNPQKRNQALIRALQACDDQYPEAERRRRHRQARDACKAKVEDDFAKVIVGTQSASVGTAASAQSIGAPRAKTTPPNSW